MFTGIIEETGIVETITTSEGGGIELVVRVKRCGSGLKRGDSLAVNGCCLTVVRIGRRAGKIRVQFDLLQATWQGTNLQYLKPGARVNLERSLRADSRLGGHFVTGHIDGVGQILRWEARGADHFLEVGASPALLRYVVFKGSIAVDGISLTVAAVSRKSFQLWIIPHTWAVTTLRQYKVGDVVNLEADLLAKYVERVSGIGS